MAYHDSQQVDRTAPGVAAGLEVLALANHVRAEGGRRVLCVQLFNVLGQFLPRLKVRLPWGCDTALTDN